MKDYYKILGISSDATEEQILALKYHPDRNPGNPEAEERFKEVAEAYGVLIDPVKRKEYDQWQAGGAQERRAAGGFRYSQEEIFRDLFRDPRFHYIFEDILREFQRAGVRHDQRFFERTFFGGRGFFFGGVFFFGPLGSGRIRMGDQFQRVPVQGYEPLKIRPPKFLKWIGEKVGNYLLGEKKALPESTSIVSNRPEDITYRITVSRNEAQEGTWVKIGIDRGSGREKLKVKIPPGTKPGTRLRLKGQGRRSGAAQGDLYLLVDIS
ncbi:MAG: J domain-containing protein [Deltaproteobacteria bacterium]|nr:J domain-containing protein [Deltaproteobacteria bacterium]